MKLGKDWKSLMDIEKVFSFIEKSFKNCTAKTRKCDERYGNFIMINFPYQIESDKTGLSLFIFSIPMDYEECVIKQGNLIKTLYKENEAMKKSLEELKVELNTKKLNEKRNESYIRLDSKEMIQLTNKLYRSIRNALMKELSQQKLMIENVPVGGIVKDNPKTDKK